MNNKIYIGKKYNENKHGFKLLIFISMISLIFSNSSCSKTVYTKYSYETIKAFDTVISFVGYETTKEKFDGYAKLGEARFLQLHQYFDIYNNYAGIANLKTINDQAGIAPVTVPKEIMDLLILSKKYYLLTNKKVNIAMGAVLEIWHQKREEGLADPARASLPDEALLKEAANHCDIDKLILDEKNMTAFLQDPAMSLDVGAVAKGFASEIVGNELKKKGLRSCIISAGGSNVKLIGSPRDGKRQKWGVGIQNPDADPLLETNDILDTVFLKDTSFVTSGDYQRYYFVGETRYHHIIDPVTLYPSDYFRAVTVLYPDSGIADLYSTALFLMTYEEGLSFVSSVKGLEAAWVFADGHIEATPVLRGSMKLLGQATGE